MKLTFAADSKSLPTAEHALVLAPAKTFGPRGRGRATIEKLLGKSLGALAIKLGNEVKPGLLGQCATSLTDKGKRLTIGVLVTLAIQTASALMWAGAAEARIKMLEMDISQTPPVFERLARLEEKVDLTRESVARIEQRLDAIQ